MWIERDRKFTLNRSSFGEKDLAISKILENKSGSFSLKPYIFSSSLSLAIDIEVSNLAMLAYMKDINSVLLKLIMMGKSKSLN